MSLSQIYSPPPSLLTHYMALRLLTSFHLVLLLVSYLLPFLNHMCQGNSSKEFRVYNQTAMVQILDLSQLALDI